MTINGQANIFWDLSQLCCGGGLSLNCLLYCDIQCIQCIFNAELCKQGICCFSLILKFFVDCFSTWLYTLGSKQLVNELDTLCWSQSSMVQNFIGHNTVQVIKLLMNICWNRGKMLKEACISGKWGLGDFLEFAVDQLESRREIGHIEIEDRNV